MELRIENAKITTFYELIYKHIFLINYAHEHFKFYAQFIVLIRDMPKFKQIYLALQISTSKKSH